MKRIDEIKSLVYKFENLGIERSQNGSILIGKAPFAGVNAWLNTIYPTLEQKDIKELESLLKTPVPTNYKSFLLNFSNGLNILLSTFYLDGIRMQLGRDVEASRQPYSIITTNIHERPRNAKDNYFFIGGYNWNSSHLYIDTETNIVHYCKRWDATSLFQWTSFEDMLISEIERIYKHFDEEGKELDEDVATTPVS